MGRSGFLIVGGALLISACATVHDEDLASWVGAPVSALDTQPIFLTMRVVRTQAEDGTEIRNYVSGRALTSCSAGGSVFGGTVSMATYNEFSSCAARFQACNNIFYIKDSKVIRYTPIGSGGGRCFTDERLRPNFHGATNL